MTLSDAKAIVRNGGAAADFAEAARLVLAALEQADLGKLNTTRLSRVTLVDDDRGGRVYERRDIAVIAMVQDDGRTLKVFVGGKRG